MAKYIKTEEGYKTPNELNLGGEVAPLIAGNYIEIKDNVIRSTLGDSLSTENGVVEKTYIDDIVPNMYYNSGSGNYKTYDSGFMTSMIPPKNNEILTVDITKSGVFHSEYTDVLYQAFDSEDGGQAVCDSELTIHWVLADASTGRCWVVLESKYNLSSGRIIIRTQPQTSYITLPKTALEYDKTPTQNSDNLITSGTAYIAIQDLKSKISSIPKFSISVVTELPTTNISTTTVYLVKNADDEGNLYTEYIYVNGWEKLGEQRIEVNTDEIWTAINSIQTELTGATATADEILETIGGES